MIPFKVLPIDEKEVTAVSQVLRAGTLGPGRVVAELEAKFAEYVGSKYAVAVDCCTSALFLCLKYRGLNNGGHLPIEVQIPSMTVPLVATTIVHAGGRIHFIDECDWVGHCYELKPYGIIDSAHKVERGQYKAYDEKDLLCYSFYPTKPISSCEGGMIATDDFEAVKWFRKARFYGRDSVSTDIKNSWEYHLEFAGWKMNMTEVQAAIALEQLKKLPELDVKRQEVVKRYNELLGLNNYSLYLYRIEVERRNDFILFMKENNVECGVHFKPLHLMKPFRGESRDVLLKTERVGDNTVSLPLYDTLELGAVDYICGLVKEWQ